ncbi:coiled-coil domain-containing protein [Halobacterium hubeiense]|uniref:hypothetical protein n=1 Tax=Halobacterium hubeiense TaxID=1407499 RepID=UPI00117BDE72|nr:hypothetical protein [Halobacterium hubeiense]
MKATVLLVTALLVVGAAAPMAVATAADGSAAADAVVTQEEDAANGTDNETETAPGARLAGVVGVQGAEVEGEVERRAFGQQVAAANSNASKASVVANQTKSLNQRLEELRERKQELETAHKNENISRGRYRAEMAGLSARISTLQAMSNETAEEARSLPDDELEAHGVNVSALDRLQTSASNLSGPEVAAIARDIAGPPGNRSAGPPFGNGMGGPPSDVPGGGEDNETDSGPGNAHGAPGNAPANPGNDGDAGNATDDDTAGPGVDAPGNDSDANTTDGNETSDGSDADGSDADSGDANAGGADSGGGGNAGPPDDAGNGNDSPGRSLVDWSALAALLP